MSVNAIGTHPPAAAPASSGITGLASGLLSVAGGATAPSAFATIASIVQQSNASTDVTTLAAPAATAATAAAKATGTTAAATTPAAFGQQLADARAAGTHVHHGHGHGHRHGSGKPSTGGVTDSTSNSTASFLNWLSASGTSTTLAADGSAPLLDVSA